MSKIIEVTTYLVHISIKITKRGFWSPTAEVQQPGAYEALSTHWLLALSHPLLAWAFFNLHDSPMR